MPECTAPWYDDSQEGSNHEKADEGKARKKTKAVQNHHHEDQRLFLARAW